MTEANLQEYALSKGIKTKVNEMKQAEKVMLRYQYVTDMSKNSVGDFARTSQSTANQMRTTRERLKELSTQFGENLIPIMTKLLDIGSKILTWFNNLDENGQNTVLVIAGLVAVIGPLLSLLGSLVTIISAIGPALAVLGTVASGPIGLVILGLTALAGVVLLIATNWDKVTASAKKFFDFISGKSTGQAQIKTTVPQANTTKTELSSQINAPAQQIDTFGIDWNNFNAKAQVNLDGKRVGEIIMPYTVSRLKTAGAR